ncbi:MAG: NADP-dependent malic enzyme [Deltaproteobacteria bacterium]|jgi:malate dehydrogenase (oxaloacetate-decarboxylating)(NADP+)|nr:NADP-dependent malic enzyme [Deltaproteobacteria bacterium]MBT6433896.1 NADP-dependent malic enzyme [Deltaproteobacteria bacterium]MBT6488969.1 NADP-dependent malic enzyme [Deltaproteobacteria bacterium]
MAKDRNKDRSKMALDYHSRAPAGKIEVVPTKPCSSQRDLSLAYTPGVAVPCLEIHKNPKKAADYTARGNLVAVVTNGTAVLGLGDIGPLASKPVMEGKAVLFKRFAGIDVFDIEVDEKDPEAFVKIVKALEPTFGGINLEDIKAPECFYIEKKLRELMNIPVFHDDQHGTAIIASAALLNATKIANKELSDCKIAFSGAGAAAIAVSRLLCLFGAQRSKIIHCDKDGVIYTGRDGLDEVLTEIATDTKCRSLAEVMEGADVFIGLSVGGLVSQDMVRSMAKDPIVFALANPDPEIGYPEAKAARDDVILATGRSDYPNQVNNVLGFPYIFRGALDCGATTVTKEMEMAAARAIGELAREDVPDSVREAYGGEEIKFGRDYLIPKPVDHRVLLWVAPAVAEAAEKSGVASRPISSMNDYRQHLASFLGRRREVMSQISTKARLNPKRLVFPEGHKVRILRACQELVQTGICHPVVLGEESLIRAKAEAVGISLDGIALVDPTKSPEHEKYTDIYYKLRQRKGIHLKQAALDMYDPVHFGMMMLRGGDVDGLVSGVSMNYADTIRPALQIIGLREDVKSVAGMYVVLQKERTLFFADTTINIEPSAEQMAEIARLTAQEVKRFDLEPRVAMISFSNFGSSPHPFATKVSHATEILHAIDPTMIVDGEMQVEYALDPGIASSEFPFSNIQGDANVLIFPSLESANVAYKLMERIGGAECVGPIVLGMNKPVNVLPRGSTAEAIYNMAAYTCVEAEDFNDS